MISDYFAELFVAGLLADKGWNVYFPHRDKGFDFIIAKEVNGFEIIRPVQVKGKYCTPDKTDKQVYGYVGALSKRHPDMVLAIPFFHHDRQDGTHLIAWMPDFTVKTTTHGFRCEPAKFQNGKAVARRAFAQYFYEDGLALLDDDWRMLPELGGQGQH